MAQDEQSEDHDMSALTWAVTAAIHTLTAWVLAAMIAAQPQAPWLETYEETATEIATVAVLDPLFQGTDGTKRTAALLVSTAWFESTFKPDAVGDHGRSVCLFQIEQSNHAALGTSREELLTNRATCVRSARRMMQISFSICRGRPTDELLGNYAGGGETCGRTGDALAKSRHRVSKAQWLFSHVRWLEESIAHHPQN